MSRLRKALGKAAPHRFNIRAHVLPRVRGPRRDGTLGVLFAYRRKGEPDAGEISLDAIAIEGCVAHNGGTRRQIELVSVAVTRVDVSTGSEKSLHRPFNDAHHEMQA